jgi:hypothetical protein
LKSRFSVLEEKADRRLFQLITSSFDLSLPLPPSEIQEQAVLFSRTVKCVAQLCGMSIVHDSSVESDRTFRNALLIDITRGSLNDSQDQRDAPSSPYRTVENASYSLPGDYFL